MLPEKSWPLPCRIICFGKRARRKLPLPCLDQKKRSGASCMDRQAGNPRVNTGIALLAAVGVAAVGAQSPYPADDRGQAGKDLPHITCNRGAMPGRSGQPDDRLALPKIVRPSSKGIDFR